MCLQQLLLVLHAAGDAGDAGGDCIYDAYDVSSGPATIGQCIVFSMLVRVRQIENSLCYDVTRAHFLKYGVDGC